MVAVDTVSLEVERGTITGLIGPNGAGKTTLFNIIAGAATPSSGRVLLAGEGRDRAAVAQPVPQGAAQDIPDRARVSNPDRVREPDDRACGARPARTCWVPGCSPHGCGRRNGSIRERAEEVIGFLGLEHVMHEPAGTLSGGQKKLLELGRTMMVDARVVLLDEVGAGVNRTLLRTIGDAILRLNRELGYTFFMIEHDMEFIARLCDPVIVMVDGQVLMQGSAETVRTDEAVIEAYLGRGMTATRPGAA